MESTSDTSEGLSHVEKHSSRSRFFKQVGITLAAATGFGALAGKASAAPFRCCPDSSCGSCGSGGTYCFCDCSGTGTPSYCWRINEACITGTGCIGCPC